MIQPRCPWGPALFSVLVIMIPLHAGDRWTGTHPDNHKTSGNDLLLLSDNHFSWVILNEEVSYPYEFSFTENLQQGEPAFTLLWNYYLQDASFKKSFSTGFNQKMEIKADGHAVYYHNVLKITELKADCNGKRTWNIRCLKDSIEIWCNQKLLLKEKGDDADKMIGSVAFQTGSFNNAYSGIKSWIKIESFTVKNDAKNKSEPLFFQYPISGNRILTVFGHKEMTEKLQELFDQMARVFLLVEEEAGVPVNHVDPVMALYEVGSGTANNLGAFVYYAGWITFPPNSDIWTLAHEMTHYYAALGITGGSAEIGDNWMLEGFANYISQRAVNRFRGNPVWTFSTEVARVKKDRVIGGAWDPPIFEGSGTGNQYAAENADLKTVAKDAAYGKGYMFLYLISELYGHEVIQKIIARNRERLAQGMMFSEDQFVQDLVDLVGEKVRDLLPGWATKGEYSNWTPADLEDPDEDGLTNLKEKQYHTDPMHMDSDNDGFPDLMEILDKTDPADPESFNKRKNWIIDGYCGDFPAKNGQRFKGTEALNVTGQWAEMILDKQGNDLIGAAAEVHDKNGHVATGIIEIMITDSDKHSVKLRFFSNDNVEFFRTNWKEGPELKREEFQGACSPLGIEFRIPLKWFTSGPLDVHVYRYTYLEAPENRFVYANIRGTWEP